MSDAAEATSTARFRIEDWMACGPGLTDPRNEVTLPSMLRRRISNVGQMAFRASYAIGEQRTARFVFCSRHGDFDRTLRILKSIVAKEPVSPADFSLSVHNALAGQLSIVWGNTAGHTAIAAGADSFAYGLLEGATSVNEAEQRVLVVYCDDVLPPPYTEIDDGTETCVALALLLAPPAHDADDFSIEIGPRGSARQPQPATSQALSFIKFMLSGEREKSVIGERSQWRWRRGA